MHTIMLVVYVNIVGLVIIYWLIKGLLTPFIDAVVSIVMTAIVVVGSFFITPLISLIDIIMQLLHRLLAPLSIKIIVYTLLGVSIVFADQLWGKQFFESNETIEFYHLPIMNNWYWVSPFAFWIGGCFLFLAAWNILKVILLLLNLLLDHPMQISIVLYK